MNPLHSTSVAVLFLAITTIFVSPISGQFPSSTLSQSSGISASLKAVKPVEVYNRRWDGLVDTLGVGHKVLNLVWIDRDSLENFTSTTAPGANLWIATTDAPSTNLRVIHVWHNMSYFESLPELRELFGGDGGENTDRNSRPSSLLLVDDRMHSWIELFRVLEHGSLLLAAQPYNYSQDFDNDGKLTDTDKFFAVTVQMATKMAAKIRPIIMGGQVMIPSEGEREEEEESSYAADESYSSVKMMNTGNNDYQNDDAANDIDGSGGGDDEEWRKKAYFDYAGDDDEEDDDDTDDFYLDDEVNNNNKNYGKDNHLFPREHSILK